MGRLHLFEFEDQPWFPSTLRGYMTDYLAFAAQLSTLPFRAFAEKLRLAMEETGSRQIVDLCSGGSGPLPQVMRLLEEGGHPVTAAMTDLHPNVDAFRQISGRHPGIRGIETPVDATAVPAELDGFRTLFNGFHHFPPALAGRILEDAMHSKKGIAVLELVGRSPPGILSVLSLLVTMPLLTPFMRPFRLSRLVFTYLLPLVPLFTLWDGLVSCLRVYSPQELERLTQPLSSPDYRWEIGRLRIGGPASVTYLIGVPVRVSDAPERR